MRHALQWEVIRALSVARGPSDTSERMSRFDSLDWKACLPWLRQSALELVLMESLKSGNGKHAIPPDVRGLWKADATLNGQRFMAMKKEFQFLVGLMEESGAPWAVLKGFSLVPDFCPAPQLRSQYDFDFLVGGDYLPRVTAALRNAGFVQKESDRTQHAIVFHHVQRKPHPPATDAGIFSPDLHRSVEVHSQLWKAGTEGINVEWPGAPLRRSIRKNWEWLSFPVLAPEDALLFQILHTFRHILNNWCRLSWFHEIAVFIKRRSGDESFWLTFQQLIQGQERLCQCTGIVFALAARLFEADISRAISPFSTGTLTPAMRLWVERYGLRSAIQNFSADKYSLLLHELFVDDPKLWLQLRSRRLFPRNRPHAIVSTDGRNGLGGWRARRRQGVHNLGRLGFHLLAGLKYMLALPSWALHRHKLSRNGGMKIPSHRILPSQLSLARARAIYGRKADV